MPLGDFTARLAQLQLSRLDNEALIARLADTSIAIALRREDGVTPHQVLREAEAAFGWPESEWPRVKAHVEGWLAEGDPPAGPGADRPRDRAMENTTDGA